ncbi:MAG: hypothetical protein FJY67_10045, partial [Calditrichaeota bacterium]|nr:hypothetical protein [Calditrichota bacterium]
MIIIENLRPGRLVLPQTKTTLQRNGQARLPAATPEIERAVKAGWIRIVETESNLDEASSESSRPTAHDWQIDYSQAQSGKITITDRSTGRHLEAEVAERKGEQHYTLKNFGTVKGMQFWPTGAALDIFDA